MRVLGLGSVVVAVLFGYCSSLQAQDGEACLRLFGAHLKDGPLTELKLSASELEVLADKRACVRSYGLPGGAEALKDLSSADLYRDKQRMNQLLATYDDIARLGIKDPKLIVAELKKRLKDPTTEDFGRLLHLGEWDRTQVKLYGEWLYIRKLREERQYQKCYTAATEVAKTFQLRLQNAPQTEADEHTYFSVAALGNFILLEQLSARSRQLSAKSLMPSDLHSLVSLLDNEVSLRWQYEFTDGDPTEGLVSRLAGLYDRVAAGPESDEPTPIGKLDVTAGYFRDGNKRVVLLKGKRTYGIVEDEEGTELISPSEAAQMFREFSRKEVATKSTVDIRLFGVHSYDGKFEVDLGEKTFTVNPAEFKDLQLGKQLPASHPLHQQILSIPETQSMVLDTHPLALKAGLLQSRGDDFVFALQKAYSDRSIYRDPFSERTATLARQLKGFEVSDPKNIFAVVADDSFAVQDYKIIQNVKSDLVKAGVTVIPFTKASQPAWTNGTGKAIIVITGHIDENLYRFITALGERGYFERNYVVFNSCRSSLSRQLVNRITTRFNAAATYSFDAKIQTASVEDFLVELTSRVAAAPSASFDVNVRSSARKAKLNGVWTICLSVPLGWPPFRFGGDQVIAA
jgi:hypothetical protein